MYEIFKVLEGNCILEKELPGAEFFVRMELDIWLNFRKTWSWIKYSYIQKLLQTIIRSLKDKENYIFKNC